jgi:regulator of protease activity HflC (stomatin/prohibitin superfamily)
MPEGPTGPTGGGAEVEEDGQQEPSVLGAAAPLAVSRQSRRQERKTGGANGDGGKRSRFSVPQKALIAVVALVFLAFTPAFLGSLKKTPRNMVGISYGGGPFEAAHFQRVVQPGSSLFFNGWFDPLYLYPADTQNYIISLAPRVGAVRGKDSILAPTSDRVQATYQVAIYFRLNIDRLRQFHETLGLQYKAYTSAGWNALLQDTFRQNVENAVQEETRRYTVSQLYGNSKNLQQLQAAVEKSLGQRLIAALGEAYFCSPTYRPGGTCNPPTFIVKQIDIPSTVSNAFVQQRAAEIQIQQRQAEAQGIAALAKQLEAVGQNYVLLKGIESGNINFWAIPTNSGLTLPTSPNGAAPSNGSGSSTGSTATTTTPTTTPTASATSGP